MVLKKVLRRLGVGGPTVDTVLSNPTCLPGGALSGEVRLVGGEVEAEIEHIALSLVTRVENEQGERPYVEFHRLVVAGPTRLVPQEPRVVPFTIPLPWEAPLTEVSGRRLPGMELGLRTELSIARSLDKGDLDPVSIAPLESHNAVLDAFGQLGFRFKSADLERGRIHGVHQELPFFQEIEFFPSSRYAGRINEVELTMVTSASGIVVVLEADKRAGVFSGDRVGRFDASHTQAVQQDWTGPIGQWLDHVASSGPIQMMQTAFGQHGHHGHHERRGPGLGGIVAGVVGGMVLGDLLAGDDEGEE